MIPNMLGSDKYKQSYEYLYILVRNHRNREMANYLLYIDIIIKENLYIMIIRRKMVKKHILIDIFLSRSIILTLF